MRISDWSSDVCSSDLDVRRVLAVNVEGCIWCAQEAVARMSTRHGGTGGAIVNVSSGSAYIGNPGDGVLYALSKGALNNLTLGLSQELAGEGLRGHGLLPRLTETDLPETVSASMRESW